jgi:hypothetical protein
MYGQEPFWQIFKILPLEYKQCFYIIWLYDLVFDPRWPRFEHDLETHLKQPSKWCSHFGWLQQVAAKWWIKFWFKYILIFFMKSYTLLILMCLCVYLISHWPKLSQKQWVHRSGGGLFVAEAVDKIWSFAVVDMYMTEFCFMFKCFTGNT